MDKVVMETDSIKLLHELQVHQIELEMQMKSLSRQTQQQKQLLRNTLCCTICTDGYLPLILMGL